MSTGRWGVVGGNPAPGDPGAYDRLSRHLADTAANAEEAHSRLAKLKESVDASIWRGKAADAFRDEIGKLPRHLRKLYESYAAASEATADYAAALRTLQAEAGDVASEAEAAESEERASREAAETAAAADPAASTVVQEAADAARQRLRIARQSVDDIRDRRRAAENKAVDALHHAGDLGIQNKRWFNKALGGLGSFARGVYEGGAELVGFAVKFSSTRALVDPLGYVEDATDMVNGLAYGVTHPVDFAKAITNWDMWLEDPARALGQLVPGIALAVATGGAGAGAKGASALSKASAVGRRGAKSADDAARLARSADELAELQRLSRLAADDLLRPAVQAEKTVTPLLDDLARGQGAELVGLEHRLKGVDSLTRKIHDSVATRADGAIDDLVGLEADKIRDALRYTVQSDGDRYTANHEAITAKLEERGFTLEKVKNTWAEPGSPQAGPYRGINSQWRTPDGQPFELQFHTPESFEMKQRTHDLYDEFRAADTPFERKMELERIMTEMSDTIPVPAGVLR